MAHVEKFTKGQVGKLMAHCQRTNANYSNKEIDSERTHLNYSLCDRGAAYALQYAKEHKALNRDNVNVIASWVITKPDSISEKETERFFQEAYSFLCNRYGVENDSNIVGAYVHMDETTPHMHFSFVPCKWNEKKGINKVNAKEVVNRLDLSKFHDDLSNHMEKVFGYDIGVKNGVTKQNQRVAELKAATKIEKELSERIAEIELIPSDKVSLINYKSQYEKMNQKINLLMAQNEVLKKEINDMQYTIDIMRIQMNRESRSVSRKKLEKLDNYEAMERNVNGYKVKLLELENELQDSVPMDTYNELKESYDWAFQLAKDSLLWIKDHSQVKGYEEIIKMIDEYAEQKELQKKAKSQEWDLER